MIVMILSRYSLDLGRLSSQQSLWMKLHKRERSTWLKMGGDPPVFSSPVLCYEDLKNLGRMTAESPLPMLSPMAFSPVKMRYWAWHQLGLWSTLVGLRDNSREESRWAQGSQRHAINEKEKDFFLLCPCKSLICPMFSLVHLVLTFYCIDTKCAKWCKSVLNKHWGPLLQSTQEIGRVPWAKPLVPSQPDGKVDQLFGEFLFEICDATKCSDENKDKVMESDGKWLLWRLAMDFVPSNAKDLVNIQLQALKSWNLLRGRCANHWSNLDAKNWVSHPIMKSKKTKPKLAISATSTVCVIVSVAKEVDRVNWSNANLQCSFHTPNFSHLKILASEQPKIAGVQITLQSICSEHFQRTQWHVKLDQLGLRHFHGYAQGPIQGSVQPQPHLNVSNHQKEHNCQALIPKQLKKSPKAVFLVIVA